MKLLTYLFTLFFVFNAIAVAPYGIKGQTQTGTLYSNVHQFPNNLVTNLGGIDALVETGNTNILSNPSFEHSIFSTGWTNVAGTFVVEPTVVVHGKKSAKVTLSSQALDLRQDSTLYQAQFADGVQGLASVRIKTTVAGLRVCSRQNGAVTASLCVNVQANGKWGLYKVPFILGGTSNGIEIDSNSVAVTGDVYVDDAFVGAVDLSADVDQSRIAGESFFAGTTSCAWSRSSSTVGSFTASAPCPGPTIVEQGMGSWQTTDSDLPRQTINNLPAGKYTATFYISSFMVLSSSSVFAINDGTTTCYPLEGNSDPAQVSATTVSCTFVYTSSGNRVFELYGASVSSTINLVNSRTSPASGTKFRLEYFGSGSVYSSTNADTDWASCGHTTSDFTGFGTVTNIETECRRDGGSLKMRGKFTAGTTTAVTAQLALKFNGTSLTTASGTRMPSLRIVGETYKDATTTSILSTVLAGTARTYLSFSTGSLIAAANNPLTEVTGSTGFTSAQIYHLKDIEVPIAGWQNSNIIIGQFNGLESCTNTIECTDTFSSYTTSAGVVRENTEWINGNISPSAGIYTYTFNSGVFTTAPNCVSSAESNAAPNLAVDCTVTSTSSTQAIIRCSQGGTNTNFAHSLICQKQGVDYIGKTAKAVASDQNVRTPSVTKAVVYSAFVGTNGIVSGEVGDFINGNCTNATPNVCTFSTPFSSPPSCVAGSGGQFDTTCFCGITAAPTTTSVSVGCLTTGGSSACTSSMPKSIICHGTQQ